MLEGKEFEKKLGEYGAVSIDVTSDLKVKVSLDATFDLITLLKEMAKKTNTPLDDKAIEWVESVIKAK